MDVGARTHGLNAWLEVAGVRIVMIPMTIIYFIRLSPSTILAREYRIILCHESRKLRSSAWPGLGVTVIAEEEDSVLDIDSNQI